MGEARPLSIIDLPFHERRYIAVVSNEDFRKHQAASSPADDTASAWPILGMIGTSLLQTSPIVLGAKFIGSLIKQGEREEKSVPPPPEQNAPKNQKQEVARIISLSDANEFTFISGSAEVGEIYAASPVNSRAYYPVETYSDDLMNHKISELERILNSLGARHYSIKLDQGESSSVGLLGGIKRLAEAKAGAELEKMRRRRFERSGTSDGKEPAMPEQLVWFHREPAWQALAESRLHHGRREFSLTVDLEQSFKLSTKAISDLRALKFEIDGHAQRHSNFSLSVAGSF